MQEPESQSQTIVGKRVQLIELTIKCKMLQMLYTHCTVNISDIGIMNEHYKIHFNSAMCSIFNADVS